MNDASSESILVPCRFEERGDVWAPFSARRGEISTACAAHLAPDGRNKSVKQTNCPKLGPWARRVLRADAALGGGLERPLKACLGAVSGPGARVSTPASGKAGQGSRQIKRHGRATETSKRTAVIGRIRTQSLS